MQHSRPTLTFKSPIPLMPTSYLLPLYLHHRLILLASPPRHAHVYLHLLLPLPPPTPSGFFNGMLAVSKPGALNFFSFFRLIPLNLFVLRNLIHFPLSGSLDPLLCDLIAPTAGLAFSLQMPCTLAAPSSFSSGRAYPSLNFLPLLFLRLTPTLIMQEINISLNNSSSLSFFNVYAPPIRSFTTDSRTDSFSPFILPSSRNVFILEDLNCHHPFSDSKGTSDPNGEEVFDWVISSDLLPFNDPDIPALFHRSSGDCSSSDISFAQSSLTPGR